MNLSRALRVHPKDVVALTGGGGKTTLMFRLAAELAAAGQRVVTTMTTRIFVSQMARAPVALVLHGERALLAQLPEALAEHGHVLIAGRILVEQDKVQGVPPDLLDRVAAQSAVDAVIVEADGSRRLPFKAPASHEPVVPSSTRVLVPVVGLDVLGQPLAPGHVHRPEIVAELAGARLGDVVTPEMIAAVLAHPLGGAKGLPPGARLVPFLNKAENDKDLDAARQIARLLLAHSDVDSVIIGAAQADDPVREVWGRAAAVVLAGGQGKRFGSLKQVLPWQGVPLVAHVADQALACPDVGRVAVTVGAQAEQVAAALSGRRVEIVAVPDWAEGQSRSVQAGLNAVGASIPPSPLPRRAGEAPTPPSPSRRGGQGGEVFTRRGAAPGEGGEVSAVLFLLADQPGVSSNLISALIQRHRETLASVVAPRFAGQRGNPVLFDRATFGEFAQLSGDIGARPIIQAHAHEIAWLDWPTPEITQDIDRADDYEPESG